MDFQFWIYLWHLVVNLLSHLWFLKTQSLPNPAVSILWFFVLSILPEILKISFRFNFYQINQNFRNLKKIHHISGNIQILGQGVFFILISTILRLKKNYENMPQIISKVFKTTFKIVLLLSWTSFHKITYNIKYNIKCKVF